LTTPLKSFYGRLRDRAHFLTFTAYPVVVQENKIFVWGSCICEVELLQFLSKNTLPLHGFSSRNGQPDALQQLS
jgi:hypothetical protein